MHALYQPKTLRRFGNFDGKGANLASVLDGYLSEPPLVVLDGDRSVSVQNSTLVGDEIETTFTHGQKGIAANVFDGSRTTKLFHQSFPDWHEITLGSLLQLPRNDAEGWWAVHVQGNRSPKGLTYGEMSLKFRADHDPYVLLVGAAVSTAVLKKAVEENHITQVKLTRIERPKDIRERITNKWTRSEERSIVEVLIKPTRGAYLLSNLILQHLKGNTAARQQILELGGVDYDRAQVEVELASGATRTFNIENLAAGHPFTVRLENLEFDANDEPIPTSMFAELRRAIEEFV
ncbi:MAG TPA: hypothetical protein VMB51_09450 [Solirubrobacteraceae bacterium]|nr:hypothetical protein [Solirubrobacteraceae bacterium]